MIRFLCAFLTVIILAVPAQSPAQEKIALTLKGAIDIALSQNLSIAEESLLFKSAEAEITRSRGDFDPALKLELNESFTKEQAVSLVTGTEQRVGSYDVAIGGKGHVGTQYELRWSNSRVRRSDNPFLTINPYYSSGLTLSVTQPLLKNYGRAAHDMNLNVARANFDAARLRTEIKAAEVIASTARAYWNLYYARANRDVAILSLEIADRLRDETKARIEAGALAPVEIHSADAEVAIRREGVVRAGKAVYDAEDILRTAMNLDDWRDELVTVQSPSEPDLDIGMNMFSEYLEEAFDRRREYRLAHEELKSKEITRRFYGNQTLPSVDLSASSGMTGLGRDTGRAFDEMTGGSYYSWQVGVIMTIPLGNRSAKGSFLKARLDEERANLNIESVKQKITAEVKEALRSVEHSREALSAARATKDASSARLEAERAKFSLGLSTLNDVFKSEEDYSVSLASEVRALTDYAVSRVNLQKAKGAFPYSRL